MTGTATPYDERRARRARREKVVSACLASSAFLYLAFFSVATTRAQQQALTPVTDTAAVERGKALLVEQCGFCHGSNARGGSGGPDLTRSVIVQEDEGGKQLGAFLRVGRPERGMPKFDLPDAQMSDLAAFLHSAIYLNSNRRLYKILDILVGDPKAGQAYFNGAGRCSSCHSPNGVGRVSLAISSGSVWGPAVCAVTRKMQPNRLKSLTYDDPRYTCRMSNRLFGGTSSFLALETS